MKTKQTKKKKVNVSFTVTPELKARFDAHSRAHNLNRSAVVEQALADYVARNQQKAA